MTSLFAGIRFGIAGYGTSSHGKAKQTKLVDLIRRNGGQTHANGKRTLCIQGMLRNDDITVILTDEKKYQEHKNGTTTVKRFAKIEKKQGMVLVSSKYIKECIKAGEMLDIGEFTLYPQKRRRVPQNQDHNDVDDHKGADLFQETLSDSSEAISSNAASLTDYPLLDLNMEYTEESETIPAPENSDIVEEVLVNRNDLSTVMKVDYKSVQHYERIIKCQREIIEQRDEEIRKLKQQVLLLKASS
jgi:hypothetical protein